MKPITPPLASSKNVEPISNILKKHFLKRLKDKILLISIAIFTLLPRANAQCPMDNFGFCMSAPYFDAGTHLYGIDIYLTDFANLYASGMYLVIEYTNSAYIIAEAETEASLNSALDVLGLNFNFAPQEIELQGIQPPLYDGFQIASTDNEYLFTIYFTSTVRSCSDFTFEMTDIIVADPPMNTSDICHGDIECEIDNYCIAGFEISGLIESPAIACDGSYDGGIRNVEVHIIESENTEIFGCNDNTDAYGNYECDVVADLDYKVVPKLNINHDCGLSSLDIDIYFDFLLYGECLDYIWQLLAGDCDGDFDIGAPDLVEIQKAILEYDVYWQSWNFVPTTVYNMMELPDCPDTGYDAVPAYDGFIEIEDIDEDKENIDFVGIKMGDANATCTDCLTSLTSYPEILSRAQPVKISNKKNEIGQYEFAFSESMTGVRVFFFAITCENEPQEIWSPLFNEGSFLTRYHQGTLYVSFLSFESEGRSFDKSKPFMLLSGNPGKMSTTGKRQQNEILSNEAYARIEVDETKEPSLFISPNPTNDILYLHSNFSPENPGIISLTNTAGSTVFLHKATESYVEMNIGHLTSGLYLYSVASKNDMHAGKLVVE